jgi:fluoroquinolone transport system permease protein
MRAVRISFFQMLKFIRKDMMLAAAGILPIFIGAIIRFGIPFIEKLLMSAIGADSVLQPYYSLFDIFYAAITPVMFCFVAAMVMLEEHDDHIDRYLFVTELGRGGYFISRIALPAVASFVVTMVVLPIFCISSLSAFEVFSLALGGTLQAIIISMLVVALSSNKLEGMALTKITSLLMLGAVVPYVMPKSYGYLLAFMPSFWTGLQITEKQPLFLPAAVAVSGVWIFILKRKLEVKIR